MHIKKQAPYSPNPMNEEGPGASHAVIRQCLLEEFESASKSCQKDSAELKSVPLGARMVSVGILCNSIEMVLKHGLKQPIDGEPSTFWYFISSAVNGRTGSARLASAVQLVEALGKVTTATGKGRSLIRHALNSGSLAELLTCMCEREGAVARCRDEWYHDYALLQSQAPPHTLLRVSPLFFPTAATTDD